MYTQISDLKSLGKMIETQNWNDRIRWAMKTKI